MKIRHCLNPSKPCFSFEFFPPRTLEAAGKLRAVRAELAPLDPEYFSVTFGAGGSTREGTWNTVLEIHGEGLPVAPHISCIGSTRESIRELLDAYRRAGIDRLVALVTRAAHVHPCAPALG